MAAVSPVRVRPGTAHWAGITGCQGHPQGCWAESGKTVRLCLRRKGYLRGDGRVIGFTSDASNLVDDDTNNSRDVFINTRPARLLRTAEPLP